MTALFPGPTWQPSSHRRSTEEPTHRLELSTPNFTTSQGPYLFVSDIGHAGLSSIDVKPTDPSPGTIISKQFEQNINFNDPSPVTTLGTDAVYPTNPSFTALNAADLKMQDTYTISPLQTRFDSGASAYPSTNSFSANGSIHSATYSPSHSTFDQWSDTTEQHSSGQKRRRESTQNDVISGPRTSGRRRQSENVEPGSARAVYLEKNRKAASKCRTKQKKQQEDLVEAARDVERRNKVLKSEVEILKSDLRDLMELVGAHNECPDTRLRRYVQLEADRLAARGDQSPIAELLSSKGSSHGSASPEKMST